MCGQLRRYGELAPCAICGRVHQLVSDTALDQTAKDLATHAKQRMRTNRLDSQKLAVARVGDEYFAAISGSNRASDPSRHVKEMFVDHLFPPEGHPPADHPDERDRSGRGNQIYDFLDLQGDFSRPEPVVIEGRPLPRKIVLISTLRYGNSVPCSIGGVDPYTGRMLNPHLHGLLTEADRYHTGAQRAGRRVPSYEMIGNDFYTYLCALPKLLQYVAEGFNSTTRIPFPRSHLRTLRMTEVQFNDARHEPGLADPCARCRRHLPILLCGWNP